MTTDTVQAYRAALKLFQKDEAALHKAMQALDAAREIADPSQITKARGYARAAEIKAEESWLELVGATRQYWKHRAEALRKQLADVAPLVAEYDSALRAAGSLVPNAGLELIRTALRPWSPPKDFEIPLDVPASKVLNDAERDCGIW
ncbi:MAG: hypothetical protein KJZ96_12175 [Rhodocyclaceae bacterium]|nr:hypothetical protein [Rhodocyclaceae bacterium]